MGDTFTCDACHGSFLKAWTDQETAIEANAAFAPGELNDAGSVCDDCWRDMRAAMPDLDERYAR